MKNIAILLLVFILGFGIASGIYSPIHKEHQVKEELITNWKKQGCDKSCPLNCPAINSNSCPQSEPIDFDQVCRNVFKREFQQIQKIKEETQEESKRWLEGFKDGYRAR
jgi:hypothetical protein